jgi:Family of unknown function (DUF6152)
MDLDSYFPASMSGTGGLSQADRIGIYSGPRSRQNLPAKAGTGRPERRRERFEAAMAMQIQTRMNTMRANTRLLIGSAGLAIVLCGVPLFGHHSFAPFDMTKTITLSCEVKEFQWTNPHCWIQMIVTDDAGKAVEWSIEANSPSSLARQGWKRTILKPGDKINISAHPLRDGRAGASLVDVTLSDGTHIGGAAATETPSQK